MSIIMHREVGFRAWDGKEMRLSPLMSEGLHHLAMWFEMHSTFSMAGNERDSQITQFTGLNDKNGTPIFEGDIYESLNGRRWIIRHGEFVYLEPHPGYLPQNVDCFGWHLQPVEPDLPPTQMRGCASGTVIGNIFENQELVESQKK